MPYQVLARKYRPLRFADVVGQDHVTRTLQNALEQGRIAHGYIFSGHRGIGKTTIARILASALNCRRDIGSPERPTPEPCLTCDSCLEIRQGNAVDVIEIDAATNRGIDEIRELRDAARYRPSRDKYKIYILDEAHQITDAAFNALLKTLEEPPDHIVFMMATTEPENIPQTIRSRCQHFSFHAVKLDDILGQLRKISGDEGVLADEAALDLLAEAGDGSMRDALSIMDQAIASAPTVEGKPQLSAAEIRDLMGTVPNTVYEDILEHVSANHAAGVLTTANRLLDAGNSPAQIARQFVRYLRNCVVAKIANLTPDSADTELLQISPDERRRAARSAMLFTEEELTRFLQVMLRTFDDLGFRQEQRFHLELGLLKLVHLQRLLPMEQFLSQLPRPPGNINPRVPHVSISGRGISAHPASAAPSPNLGSSAPATAATTPSFRQEDAQLPRASAVEHPAILPTPQEPVLSTGATAHNPEAELVPSRAVEKPAVLSSGTESGVPHVPILGHGTEAATDSAGVPHVPILGHGFEAATDSATKAANPIHIAINLPNTKQPSNVPKLAQPDAAIGPNASTGIHTHPSGEPYFDVDSASSASSFAATPNQPIPPPDPEATEPATTPTSAFPEATQQTEDLQTAAVEALFAAGTHNSAAEQLQETTWTVADGELRIQTSLSKQLMSTIFRPDVEAILKGALRNKGVTGLRIVFLPGALETKPKTPKKPRTGSAQAKALEHPTVQAAQKLFNAEITGVFDLHRD